MMRPTHARMNPARPLATLALIGLAALVYLAMTYLPSNAIVAPLLISEYPRHYPWLFLPEIRGGEIWRLVTPIFLHFGIFHVVFNLLWLWELGRIIEARQGAITLLGLVALTGAFSNLGQYVVSGPLFGGMSGVVYGCFGYLWIQGLFSPAYPRLRRPVVFLLLGWLAVAWSGVLEALFNLRVANTAHAAGLLCGIALGVVSLAAGKLFGARRSI